MSRKIELDEATEKSIKEQSETYRWALTLMNPNNLIEDRCENADDIIYNELRQAKLNELKEKYDAEHPASEDEHDNKSVSVAAVHESYLPPQSEVDESVAAVEDDAAVELARLEEELKKLQASAELVVEEPQEVVATPVKKTTAVAAAAASTITVEDDIDFIRNAPTMSRAEKILDDIRTKSRENSRRPSEASISNPPKHQQQQKPTKANEEKRRKPSAQVDDDDILALNVSGYGIKKSGGKSRSSRRDSPQRGKGAAATNNVPKHPAHRFEEAPRHGIHSDLRQKRILQDIKKNCKKLCNELGKKLEDEGISDESSKDDWMFLQDDLEEEKKQADFSQAGKQGTTLISWLFEKGIDSVHPMGLEAEDWTETVEKDWDSKYKPYFDRWYYDSSLPILRDIPPAVNFINTYGSQYRAHHLEVVKRKAMSRANAEEKEKDGASGATAAQTQPPAEDTPPEVSNSPPPSRYADPPPPKSDKYAYAQWWYKTYQPEKYYKMMAQRQLPPPTTSAPPPTVQQQQPQPSAPTAEEVINQENSPPATINLPVAAPKIDAKEAISSKAEMYRRLKENMRKQAGVV